MSDLVEFLRARLAEDKQLALAVAGTGDMWWVTRLHVSQDLDPVRTHCQDRERTTLARCFDSARVLREVAAKQALADHLAGIIAERLPNPVVPRSMAKVARARAEYALRLLVLPYAGHPDCRQEWTP